jgi:hypothetical protein
VILTTHNSPNNLYGALYRTKISDETSRIDVAMRTPNETKFKTFEEKETYNKKSRIITFQKELGINLDFYV